MQSGPCCPITCALELLGDRWSLSLMRDMLLFGRRRYSELLASSGPISTNILASRLKQLQEGELIERFKDPLDGKAAIYIPTDKGVSLIPVLVEMVRWGLQNDERALLVPYLERELVHDNAKLQQRVSAQIAEERDALTSAA
ncbi:transcriptional regulator [Halioglobus maricola]|uniref:Transcriptional regulator n=2 Tax=Halioglobus maricola TaxID=2601894 RepID=A0A5P9NPN4_9GAMM|nr:transcriptional regulator [Halioglobus maricola]